MERGQPIKKYGKKRRKNDWTIYILPEPNP